MTTYTSHTRDTPAPLSSSCFCIGILLTLSLNACRASTRCASTSLTADPLSPAACAVAIGNTSAQSLVVSLVLLDISEISARETECIDGIEVERFELPSVTVVRLPCELPSELPSETPLPSSDPDVELGTPNGRALRMSARGRRGNSATPSSSALRSWSSA